MRIDYHVKKKKLAQGDNCGSCNKLKGQVSGVKSWSLKQDQIMLFAAIVWGKRINMQRISNHGFTPSLLKLTARQLW
jgi:hypothetical protein